MRYLARRSPEHIRFVHVAVPMWRARQVHQYPSLSFRSRSVDHDVSSANCVLVADISHVDDA
jgi:hypothetical protein